MCLRHGLCPGPQTPLRDLTALLRPVSWIRGGEEKGKERRRERREREGREWINPQTKSLATALSESFANNL